MAKQLKLRRGTTSQHSSFTGAEGECTVDTTKDTLVVHDGSQAGGRPLLREDLSNIGTGVVTHVMLTADCVDGDNIADDSVITTAGVRLGDSTTSSDHAVIFGADSDMRVYHDGSNGVFQNDTGTLFIQNDAGGADIYIRAKAGETSILCQADSQVKLFYDNSEKLATLSGGVSVSGNLDVAGGVFIGGSDHFLYQDSADRVNFRVGPSGGTHVYGGFASQESSFAVGNASGDLRLTAGNASPPKTSVLCKTDGAVELYHNNTKQFETDSTGAHFVDSKTLKFGTSYDLTIFHDGSHSVISDIGQGSLIIKGSQTKIQTPTGEESAIFNSNGSVDLYHDNVKAVCTYSDGLKVTSGGHLAVNNATSGGACAIEIGGDTPGNHFAYIDLVGETNASGVGTYTDYALRLIRTNGGANADSKLVHRGTGILQLGGQDGGKTCFGSFSDAYAFDNVSYAAVQIVSAGVASLACRQNSTGGQTAVSFFNPNGRVGYIGTNGSATSYNSGSDYRLKENEVAISDGITRLKTLKPYRFNFKTEPSKTVDGFFAHEVTSAVPEAITGTKDETHNLTYVESDDIPEGKKVGDVKEANVPLYQCIDQSKIVPLLTAALQEAIAKIETLETKVAALEG